MAMTKQGVRNLNTGYSNKTHEHKYVPITVYVGRGRNQVTQMKCFCGEVLPDEPADERQERERKELEEELASWTG